MLKIDLGEDGVEPRFEASGSLRTIVGELVAIVVCVEVAFGNRIDVRGLLRDDEMLNVEAAKFNFKKMFTKDEGDKNVVD